MELCRNCACVQTFSIVLAQQSVERVINNVLGMYSRLKCMKGTKYGVYRYAKNCMTALLST